MINVIMNIDEIIIRNAKALFNVEEFSKEVMRMCITFLINLFFRIQLNDIGREVSRFDYVHNFFKYSSNDSTFAERN